MSIIITDFEQNSPEWYRARLGSVGASSVDKIITSKGEPSKQRTDYLYQLAGEILTGRAEETYQSQAMINGHEREAASRVLFEMIYGIEVKQCALVYKDERKLFHCSPDGLVWDNEPLELKNPMMKTQIKYLLSGNLPPEYFIQTQMQLYVCEKERGYFMSCYDGLRPLIVPVYRDEAFLAKLEHELETFVCELAEIVEKLSKE